MSERLKMRARTRYSLVIFGILLVVYLMLWDTIAKPLFEAQASDLYGGEVSIDRLDMSVWQGKTTLYHIQVADRSNPMRNLAEAHRVYIDIHLMKLLARNVVDVESMEIEGLTVFTDREKPAETIRPLIDPDSDLAKADLPDFELPDLDALIAQRQSELESDLIQLEDVFRATDAKWRPRIAELPTTEEIASLRAQSDELERAYKNGDASTELTEQARQVQQEISVRLAAINVMYLEFTHDMQQLRAALAEADQLPIRHSRSMLRDLGLSPEQTARLGNEMLRGELSGVLQQVLAPIVYSSAGEVDQTKTPVHIEQASISGHLLNPAKELQVSGELRNFTWPLEQAGEAATLELAGRGSEGGLVQISARVDHRAGVSDDIEMSIQNLMMQGMQLEGDEELALELSAARATIEGGLKIRGNELSGNINQQYTETNFKTQLAPDAREAAQLIATMLENNHDYRINMRFAGTPSSPQITYASDMDQQFSATIKAAIADEVGRIIAAIERRAAEEARPRIAQARETIAELRELEASLAASLGDQKTVSK